jgi:hypothetical protein
MVVCVNLKDCINVSVELIIFCFLLFNMFIGLFVIISSWNRVRDIHRCPTGGECGY